GFDRFLLGPSEIQLKSLASDDHIIVFNISPIRNDAFVVTKETICLIRLHRLTQTDIEYNTYCFTVAAKRESLKQCYEARQDLSKVLEWLWDSTVGPILEDSGIVGSPSEHEHW